MFDTQELLRRLCSTAKDANLPCRSLHFPVIPPDALPSSSSSFSSSSSSVPDIAAAATAAAATPLGAGEESADNTSAELALNGIDRTLAQETSVAVTLSDFAVLLHTPATRASYQAATLAAIDSHTMTLSGTRPTLDSAPIKLSAI